MPAPTITSPADGATITRTRGVGFDPASIVTDGTANYLSFGGDYVGVIYSADEGTTEFGLALVDAEPDVGTGTMTVAPSVTGEDGEEFGPTFTYNVVVVDQVTGSYFAPAEIYGVEGVTN